jgi:hypothetical protein
MCLRILFNHSTMGDGRAWHARQGARRTLAGLIADLLGCVRLPEQCAGGLCSMNTFLPLPVLE